MILQNRDLDCVSEEDISIFEIVRDGRADGRTDKRAQKDSHLTRIDNMCTL